MSRTRGNNALSKWSSVETQEKQLDMATSLKHEWLGERSRRIDELKRGVKDGTYKVKSQEVAKALLVFEKN